MKKVTGTISFRYLLGNCTCHLFLNAFFLFFLSGTCFAQTDAPVWNIEKSEHFIVYYQDTGSEYVDKLIDRAEYFYNSIVDTLGFTRFDNFWTWDNRCKVYIYPSQEAYEKNTGQPHWSEASVNVRDKIINTFFNEENFYESLLPHELGHIVFRQYVGVNIVLPLWLDEGVACMQEQSKSRRLALARKLLGSNSFISLDQLMGKGGRMSLRDILSPGPFYAESLSLVDFLLSEYGKEKFVDYCRELKDNKSNWLDSLLSKYDFKDISDMNDKWINFLTMN
jgi:hypothetical protein